MMRRSVLRMRSTLGALPSTFWALWGGTFINRMGMLVLPFLTIYLTSARHLTADRVGLLAALPGVGGVIASVLMSVLADRVDRKQLLALTLLASAALLLFVPFLSSLLWLAAIVFAWSVVSEMQRPLSNTLVTDVVPADQRKQAISLLRIAINIGTAVSAALGGLIAAIAYLPLFIADAATTVIFALLTLARLPVSKRPAPEDHPRAYFMQALTPFRDGAFRRLWLAGFLGVVVYSQITTTFAIYLLHRGGSPPLYGGLMALNGILITLVEFPLVTAIAHLPAARVMALGCLAYAGAAALCGLISVPVWLVLPVLAFTGGEMLFSPAFGVVGADLAPLEQRGAYMGWLWTASSLGYVVGPILGGELLHLSPLLCWGTLLLIGVIGAVLAWLTPQARAFRGLPAVP
ncbi:MAG TPA: MFS transporter [Ktedonobacterales bacterium]|jgi:MFS family permease